MNKGYLLSREHINQVCELFQGKTQESMCLFEINQGLGEYLELFNEIKVPEKAVVYSTYGGVGIDVKFIIAAIKDCVKCGHGLAMVHNHYGNCEMSPTDLNTESKILDIAKYYRLSHLITMIISENSLLQRIFKYNDNEFTMSQITISII
jgi:hypothetical protein